MVDNGSTDRTLEEVERFKNQSSLGHQVKVVEYPFQIAQCGKAHYATEENSVHSLVYFNNWSLSQCGCKAVCKWDADMILSPDDKKKKAMERFLDLFAKGQDRYGSFPVQTVYLDPEGSKYLSVSEVNREVRIFRNCTSNYFVKADEWERLSVNRGAPSFLREIAVYEYKDVSKDEFAHWSERRFHSERKVREFRNFHRFQLSHYRENPAMFRPIRVVSERDKVG